MLSLQCSLATWLLMCADFAGPDEMTFLIEHSLFYRLCRAAHKLIVCKILGIWHLKSLEIMSLQYRVR